MPLIPLFIPDMPVAGDLMPYLCEIDKDKWYSNFGPKLNQFEACLAHHFKVERNSIVTSSSATTGLMMALKAIACEFNENRKTQFKCLLPAWTFVASAQAVLEAGGCPLFCDVARDTGAITVEGVERYLSGLNGEMPDIVMPVAPFSSRVDVAEWDAFTKRTGIPVVIDAAASFFSITPGLSPVVVSLHATKSFGVGEGGVIISDNKSLIQKMHQISRFGFAEARVAISRGGNYKLSEYHAVVGLSQFDRLSKLKARYLEARKHYRSKLSAMENVTLFGAGDDVISSTLNVSIQKVTAKKAVEKLRERGVEAAVWWEDILYQNPIFNKLCASNKFPVSDDLYDGVFGVPFYSGITEKEIDCVLDAIRAI
ncbi:DegT/DnrJ/EryC1/StrS family aminotransferase [Kiloniella litopenaei]|uniref:DegT/DnrJ/EryC1/StrS family aminotransferase n=1 Tax=Kiloniella litopenaei TaxID=1549748 RepID=UPI003BA9967F